LLARILALAERKAGRSLPRAMVPQIELAGPKIRRQLATICMRTVSMSDSLCELAVIG
jgi:hypothetical protein